LYFHKEARPAAKPPVRLGLTGRALPHGFPVAICPRDQCLFGHALAGATPLRGASAHYAAIVVITGPAPSGPTESGPVCGAAEADANTTGADAVVPVSSPPSARTLSRKVDAVPASALTVDPVDQFEANYLAPAPGAEFRTAGFKEADMTLRGNERKRRESAPCSSREHNGAKLCGDVAVILASHHRRAKPHN
jgi:hypothetical protein